MLSRWLLILCGIAFLSILAAEDLNVSVNQKRFFDENGNTVFEINYEIAYKDLNFIWSDSLGYAADLFIDFKLLKNDKLIYEDDFNNKIIVRNKVSPASDDSFKDKITFALAKPEFVFMLFLQDQNSNLSLSWELDCRLLEAGSLISDLELSSHISPGSDNYLPKFQRGDLLYDVNVNQIFSLVKTDSLILYCELQNYELNEMGNCDIEMNIIIQKNNTTIGKFTETIITNQRSYPFLYRIELGEFESGYHSLYVEVYDKLSNTFDTKQDFFSIKLPKLFTQRLFVDMDDDLKLIGYFHDRSQHKNWKKLTEDGLNRFINRFWTYNDPDPTTEENEFFELIKERINYSNSEFSHFDEGWKTDRGRVYLRYGKPDEIISMNTGLNTRYAQKELQIWKYRSNVFITYIFIDLQTSGNFRMIYAEGDELESSTAAWESYLGDDFDMGILK